MFISLWIVFLKSLSLLLFRLRLLMADVYVGLSHFETSSINVLWKSRYIWRKSFVHQLTFWQLNYPREQLNLPSGSSTAPGGGAVWVPGSSLLELEVLRQAPARCADNTSWAKTTPFFSNVSFRPPCCSLSKKLYSLQKAKIVDRFSTNRSTHLLRPI